MKIINLVSAETALIKLYQYGYISASQIFYLSTTQQQVCSLIDSYNEARNSLLRKHGESEDGIKYAILPENESEYLAELDELENQEVDISFPPGKITLCAESINLIEKKLSPEKWLGFSPNDWNVIRKIITVIEKEG